VHRKALLLQRREKAAELGGCRPADDGGWVPPFAANRRSNEASLLLRDLDWIERPSSRPLRETSEFAERVANAREELRVLLDQILGASSSTVSAMIKSPAGASPSVAARRDAARIMAIPPFMSSAPLPQTSPSTMSALNGGWRHSAAFAGTTSTWP
jgi:hypothetical protein